MNTTDVRASEAASDVERLPTTEAPASWYRPHLDGLRTIAVYLVLLFHAGVDRFSGGFIGVDVFFVLSGYLVTQMVFRDVERGGIRFGRFYARRIRRLLPASAVMLVLTAAVFAAVAAPGEADASRGGFQASFLYVSNWYFIRQSTGYFGDAIQQSPVLHMWSLAVEEQFYILWPMVLGGLLWVARRGRRRPVVWVRAMVAFGAVCSLGWALVLQGSSPDRAYYGTDARAYQLLAGALLALSPGLIGRVRRRVPVRSAAATGVAVAIVLLIVAATSLVSLAPIGRGLVAVVLTLVIIVGLEIQPKGLVGRSLATEPMVYLGRISYGTYLWHWPVIVIVSNVADPSPLGMVGVSAVVATGLAALSSHLLELPIRRSPLLDRHTSAVIVAGLAVGVAGAVVVIPALLTEPVDATPTVTSSASFTPVPDDLPLGQIKRDAFSRTVDCLGQAPAACTIVDGPGQHIMLMGDSNAQMWIAGFESMARAEGFRLSLAVTRGCPWQRGINPFPELSPMCIKNKEDAYERVVPALAPDLIVLVNSQRLTGALLGMDDPAGISAASLDQLRAPGRSIVLLDPVAGPDEEPLSCLQEATYLEDCRFVIDMAPSPIDEVYREVAAGREGVQVADPQILACPYQPICDPLIGGNVVWWDRRHLAVAYSASLGDELTSFLDALGVLER